MDLNFSQKGLRIFDASTLSKRVQGCSESLVEAEGVLAKLLERAPSIRSINLSKNSIHRFTGGASLRTVKVLDLSFNCLTSLESSSLPSGLVRLNLAHNQLTCLDRLDQFLPLLEELDVGHNALVSEGVKNLPGTLISLDLKSNRLEDLLSLSSLVRLVKLDVSKNRIESPNALLMLTSLPHLRCLDFRGNPLTDSTVDFRVILRNVAPRLSFLNGLSVPPVEATNSMSRSAGVKLTDEHIRRGLSHNRSGSLPRSFVDSSYLSSTPLPTQETLQPPKKKQSTKVFLAETKVKELEKMLGESQKAEQQALKERELLLDQVKGCAKVIQDQNTQLVAFQKTVLLLKKEEEKLKKSATEVERVFEQTHASLMSHRLNNSSFS